MPPSEPSVPVVATPAPGLSLRDVVALVSFALTFLGGGAVYGSLKTRVDLLEKSQAAAMQAMEQRIAALEKESIAHEIRIQRGEDNYGRILERLGELKSAVNQMSGVQPARGHR